MPKSTIQRYATAQKRVIYSMPLRAFPSLVTNVFLIDDGSTLTLVDCGSGFYHSNEDLLAGFEAIRSQYNQSFKLADLDVVLITHGHIDHYGALPFVREHNQKATIGVHALDRAILENPADRQTTAVSRLIHFLTIADVDPALQQQLLKVYIFGKEFYSATPTQFELKEGVPTPNEFEVFHVPGHCPGLVCLQVDDILLTADHILSHTTPHQAPESITPNMGLRHYFDSLDKIARLDGISLAVGCHEDAMPDLRGRIQAIRSMHEKRLAKIHAICQEPQTISEISQALFGTVKHFHVLLALEEAGAHIEYLYQHGQLIATNLDEIAADPYAPIRYIAN